MGTISKTKLLKKRNYTPGSTYITNTPAPAKKAEKPIKVFNNGIVIPFVKNRDVKKEVRLRNRARLYTRIVKSGLTEEQINKFKRDKNLCTITCLPYGSYSVKLDDKTILHGTAAITHELEKQKIEILSSTNSFVFINAKKSAIDNITEIMKDMGRMYIYDWCLYEKKPSENTKEIQKKAKNAKKAAKKQFVDMRPYYAAKRNGKVSYRIRKFNPTLAKKIEEWLKDHPSTGKKHHNPKKHSYVSKNTTLAEIKAIRRANRVGRMIIKKEEKIALEAKKQAKNAKNLAARIKKAAVKRGKQLKIAA